MRRLIELRVFPDVWLLTPSFAERIVRLSYPSNDGCQSVLVAQSPSFYPVVLSNVRSFTLKPEKDQFEVASNLFPVEALAFRAIPKDFRNKSAWCRVLVEVETGATGGTSDEQAQNLLLAQHTTAIEGLQQQINALADPTPVQWIDADLGGRWINYGPPYAPAAYCKHAGKVYLRGAMIYQGVYEIFTLPVGYRPAYRMTFPVTTYQISFGVMIGMVAIGADGVVSWGELGAGDYFSLDGVSFGV